MVARARNVKPGLFINNELAEIDPLGRLLFIGLWTIADREGRLKDIPVKIKAQVLPYDDCDVDRLLADLATKDFITRYDVDGSQYIQINNFLKHQNPHMKEAASEIPPPCQNDAHSEVAPNKHSKSTVQAQKEHTTNPADSLNPLIDSLTPLPDSLKDPGGRGGVDGGFKKIVKAYENNLHPLTPINQDMLCDWLNEGMDADVIVYAIKQAVQANVRTAKYVNGILRNLFAENVRTMAGVEARERDHTNTKQGKKFNEGNGAGGKPYKKALTPAEIKRADEAQKRIQEASERMRLKYESEESVP